MQNTGGFNIIQGVRELHCAEYCGVQLLYRRIQYYTEGFKNYLVQNTGWFNYYTGGFKNYLVQNYFVQNYLMQNYLVQNYLVQNYLVLNNDEA